jgi:hypothetical protein
MKLFTLNWSILKAAELVGNLPDHMPTPKPLLKRIYSGNGMRLMDSSKPRKWSITITTKAKSDDGEIHTHIMRFKPDTAMFLSELINAVKHAWIDEADKDLADLTAIEALAVARCTV